MKKVFSLFLVVIFMLSTYSFYACVKKDKVYDPSNFLTESQAEELYGNRYRIVKNPVTLELFVPRGSMNPAYSTMKMFKKLSEITNLRFSFVEADTSSYTNLRNAAWSGGDLPDMFLFANTISEQVIYSERNALVAFNDPDLKVGELEVGSLIDGYMPTYKKLLDDNFNIATSVSAKKVVTLADGKMYALVSANDVPRDLTYKMWINNTWIKNINENFKARLKVDFGINELPEADNIRTIDEFMTVLRAFKKYDANLNDEANDEVPVSSVSMQYLRNFIMQAYGVVVNGVEINAQGTEFTYTPASDAYRKYLQTANIMFSEGLMDNGTFSNKDSAQLAGKGYQNRIGVFCAAAAYLVASYKYDGDYETFGPIVSDYYSGPPIQYGFSPFVANGAMIPRGTPYVRELARLLDIMYSDIGVQLISYGEEGVDWTWDDEAKTSWTFHVPNDWKGTQEEYRATISPNVGTGASLYWQYEFVGKMNDAIIKKLNSKSERYMPYIKIPVSEEIILDKNDYEPISRLRVNIDTYVEMTEYNFIKGERGYNVNLDADWNAYLSTLKSYKYEELLTMYNNALAKRS